MKEKKRTDLNLSFYRFFVNELPHRKRCDIYDGNPSTQLRVIFT